MAGRHARKPSLTESGKRNHRKLWIILSSTALVLLAGVSGAYYFFTKPLTHNISYPNFPVAANTTNPSATSPDVGQKRLNVLLIGTDTRPGETGGNTDVLILASIDPTDKRIEMMSIPRDTKVMYPDGSYAKINQALVLGGPALTESLVTQLTGEKIDDYALTHFGGLVDIINTIGGITLNVPERMYYNTGDKEYNIINLKPGTQTLNGAQALGFVRFRHDALGDIGRTERQQEFLQALSDKLLQPQNITKLPTLIREFWGTIDTNMSLLDVLKIAANAENYRGYPIIHETLPGSFHNPDPSIKNDESYWIVNPLQAKYVSQQFFQNGVVQQNPIQDPSVTENWTPPSQNEGTSSQVNDPSNSSEANSATAGNTTESTGNGTDNSGSSNPSVVASKDSNSAAGNESDWSVVAIPEKAMVVTVRSAYIRSGPNTSFPVIASVLQGQSVSVVGQSGQWDEVVVGNGEMGYMADWLLGPSNP